MTATHVAVPRAMPRTGLRILSARALLRLWLDRRHDRREFARLLRVGPHMVDDIGMTVEQARREAAKPFWRD